MILESAHSNVEEEIIRTLLDMGSCGLPVAKEARSVPIYILNSFGLNYNCRLCAP